MTDLSLTVRKHIPAPAARVYGAWLDPTMLMQFVKAGPGMTSPKADCDVRVGGRFLIVMRNGETDIPHSGTYLELNPHSRIAFTWESAFSTEEGSTVTLDFAPDGDGTLVTLTHIRFANEGSRDGHQSGWTAILESLAATAF